nr:MAG TPA: hypothetical protein [Caudoviricetes sp.]
MAENIIIHEISIAGYKATSPGGMLDLGTWGSYGIEKLHLTLDAAWQDLTITAFFNVNGKVVAKRVVGKDGYADVPWEATKENTFSGCLAFEGSINGQRRISTNLNYKVTNHSETTDSDPVPTDDRWNQFVTETKGYRDGAFEAAEKANARAEDAETASEDAQAAARAAKASENAAAASASNAAASADKAGPYAKAAQAAQEAAENAAAAAAASKSAADTLAAEAARAALAAENSKAAANNAAYFAGENATAAQKAAATATAAASDAGQSASDAAASKAAAETAAKAAQDAQTATAAAKADAVKAQTAAQAAAKKAQDAKSAAEKVRDDAKTAQKGAEAARDVAAKSAEAAAKSEANVKQSADTLAESVKNITPDDSSIGDKPWSSKHIIDMLCPPLEESGNPVVCYPVAGYALGVKAMWEPAQEGTGTPSPENIRPIKGRDSVMVDRCGENVIEFLSTEDSSSDIKIAVDAEKNITLNGTLAGKGNITIGTCRLHWVAGKTYTMYVKKVGGSVSLGSGDGITFAYALFTTDYNHFFRGGTNSTNLDVYIASDAALVETELVFMLQCWRKGTVFNNFKFQIEVVEGTTAPTTYTPYIGQTNTLTLPETVYGGEVDAVSSEGQETQKLVILNGTESWNSWGINAHNPAITGFYTYDINDYDAINSKGICSHLETPNQDVWGGRNAGIGFATVGSSRYFMFSMLTSSLPDISAGHEVVSLKAYLAAQNDAGTPVQIAYKLAEPVPFTATGAQPLSALAGVNTVLTDADSANVTGRADPIKRIADLEDAVASIN